MRVSFIVGGAFVVELNLPINPDPNLVAASLVHHVTAALQQRPELQGVGGVYAVTYAGEDFGSQDDLDMNDVELNEESHFVVWATLMPRKKVARNIEQMLDVATVEELIGSNKRQRLTDAGDFVVV